MDDILEEEEAERQIAAQFTTQYMKEIEELRKTGTLKHNWMPEQCGEIPASNETIAWAERNVTGKPE